MTFLKCFHVVTRMKINHQLYTKSDKEQDILKHFSSLLEEVHFNKGVTQSFPS